MDFMGPFQGRTQDFFRGRGRKIDHYIYDVCSVKKGRIAFVKSIDPGQPAQIGKTFSYQ